MPTIMGLVPLVESHFKLKLANCNNSTCASIQQEVGKDFEPYFLSSCLISVGSFM